MKDSTKIMVKGGLAYLSELALTSIGSYYGGRWAGKAKTIPGVIVRLSGVLGLCVGSSGTRESIGICSRRLMV